MGGRGGKRKLKIFRVRAMIVIEKILNNRKKSASNAKRMKEDRLCRGEGFILQKGMTPQSRRNPQGTLPLIPV